MGKEPPWLGHSIWTREHFRVIESETEVRYGRDRPTIDAEDSKSVNDELGAAAESLAAEFVIGIVIGVLAIAIVGLRLRKRQRREPKVVLVG